MRLLDCGILNFLVCDLLVEPNGLLVGLCSSGIAIRQFSSLNTKISLFIKRRFSRLGQPNSCIIAEGLSGRSYLYSVKRTARLWTASIALIFIAVWGDHMHEPYSRMGRTVAMYALSLVGVGHRPRFCLSSASTRLALATVLLMWLFHVVLKLQAEVRVWSCCW